MRLTNYLFKLLFRPVEAPRRSSWLLSLTTICFLCGGLGAFQVRAVQQSQRTRFDQVQWDAKKQISRAKTENEVAILRRKLDAEHRARLQMAAQLGNLKAEIRQNYVPQKTALQWKAEVERLKNWASLTQNEGEGVVITLNDNRKAHFDGVNDRPEMVHDFDLQQAVHELLSVKAEAIAIKGAGENPIRITGRTPIRCVGPAILVNFQPIVAPYEIWALGNAMKLANALEMPNGIRNRARNDGLIVEIGKAKHLKLPAANDFS